MTVEKTFILYSLPKNRTTQQLNGGRKVETAWGNVCNFLTNCTTINPDSPTKISMTAYEAFPGDSNPEIADKIIEETKKVFDNAKTAPLAYFYSSGIPTKQTTTTWEIDKKNLNKALDYLSKGQPWPKFSIGPIELIISYDFKLVDPKTRKEIPNQKNESSLLIWLSRTCFCSPLFYFPFEQAGNEFHDYLNNIKPFIPFKLEDKYLRLGRTNKNKTNYIYTKLKQN